MKKQYLSLGLLISFFLGYLLYFSSDKLFFLYIFFKRPHSVGAIAPSSSFLASKMLAALSQRPNRAIRVLEVGAGTGEFTRAIVKLLRPGDHFDVIEIDQDFCEHLRNIFQGPDFLHEDGPVVALHCCSVLSWVSDKRYDYIISGLPFNAFDADFIFSCKQKYKELIIPEGVISYFEYPLVPQLKRFFYRITFQRERYLAFDLLRESLASFQKDFSVASSLEYRNLPPARVYYLSPRNQ